MICMGMCWNLWKIPICMIHLFHDEMCKNSLKPNDHEADALDSGITTEPRQCRHTMFECVVFFFVYLCVRRSLTLSTSLNAFFFHQTVFNNSWLRIQTLLLHGLFHCSHWKTIKRQKLQICTQQLCLKGRHFFPSCNNLTMTFTATFHAGTSLNGFELLKSASCVYSLWLGQ